MNSLRIRLILMLTTGFAIAWIGAAWFTHKEAREEVDKLFDAQLAQSAQVLLDTTSHELQERKERDEGNDSDKEQVIHEYEQKQAFQIWNGDTLLMRSTFAPNVAFAKRHTGYSDVTLNNQPWRVFTRWDKQYEFMIQVAEPLARREELASHIALRMLVPLLLAFPILIGLIWGAVSAGLRPLQQLTQEVKQREANRLDAIPMTDVPDEVAPLVEALNELFAKLRRAFEAERDFTSDAAHELRTPLAALKTQAQVAMRSKASAERQSALENVIRGVDRATRLVAQLLALARVDPETAASGFEKIDLRLIVTQVLAENLPYAQAKNISLEFANGTPCYLHGNAPQLELMLRNLIDNAIRYSPTGENVSVNLQETNGILLTVSDNGCGIPAEEREKILQRFYRITSSNREEGSGLGLSIVKRIVELHHAQLQFANNEGGQGLVVKVIFPT